MLRVEHITFKIMNKVLKNLNFISIIASQTEKMLLKLMKSFQVKESGSRAIVCIISILVLSSCTGRGTRVLDETPTRGNIKITVDESFQPLLDTEVFTFTHLYTNASVTPQYKPEYDVINDYMDDSVKVIVTSKKLTDSQVQYLRESQIVARTTTFAYDALALVTHKTNRDTLINYNIIKDIFLGKITRWNEINPKSKLGDIQVIFDNTKSGNIRYFKELFEIQDKLQDNFFAVNSNPEVIDFVSRNPNSLGIVSVNWISDKDDSLSMSFVKKINVLAISQPYFNDGTYYRQIGRAHV